VAAIVLPSSPALPDGDVDPALVEAAIAAAIETAPAKPAGATTKATARVAPTAGKVAAEGTVTAESTAKPQATAVVPAPATTTDQPVTAAEPAAREGGSPGTSGHGGRLDLQVQAAPRSQAAPDTTVETPVAIIDRERVERLADGLAARLKVSHAADGARIRMQLEPRELGEVVVRLEIRNGMAHAHLIAESADAGAALQASLADLRSSLADRGLQLESVSIRVAGESASNSRDQTGQPQGDRRSRAPLSFGRIDPAATIAAAADQIDRAREGQAVWMLA
jgi:flagellar hook-length control protein FliK